MIDTDMSPTQMSLTSEIDPIPSSEASRRIVHAMDPGLERLLCSVSLHVLADFAVKHLEVQES